MWMTNHEFRHTLNMGLNEGLGVELDLLREANDLSGQMVELCYHCHKCTAGCPVVEAMDYGPDRILRMVALNQADQLFTSRDIWLCVGCFTCATRCPNDINIAAVMDALRQLAERKGYRAGERDARLFHRLFLGTVQRLGRSHEAVMLGLFKVFSHVPLTNDIKAGAGLFLRGKVPLLPELTRARKEVKPLFRSRRE
jgi:heterodisulfide reductase subunit C